jgi:hypothetical protein
MGDHSAFLVRNSFRLQENRGAPEPGGVGTISQQEQPPHQFWGTPSASSTTKNDVSHGRDIPPVTTLHQTRTMVTPVTKVLAEIECSQTRSGAPKLRRQAYDRDDPSHDHKRLPSSSSSSPTPLPQPPDSLHLSPSPTNTSNPQATSPAPSDVVKLYIPPVLEWTHCVVIMTLVVVYCLYRMYRMLHNARYSLPESSESEPCDHADDRPAVFSGPGRTWGPTGKHSRSREWLRKKRLRAERKLRDAVIHYAQLIALAKRTKRAIEDSRIRV